MNILHDLLPLITPQMVLAGVVSTLVGIIAAGAGWALRQLFEAATVQCRLPYQIKGEWYSIEYVPKHDSAAERHVLTKIKLRKRLFHSGWRLKVVQQLPAQRNPDDQTVWRFTGHLVHGDSLVGEWESTVPNTKRYGVAMLQFVDNARAIGYWVGVSRRNHPVYGYWIMSRTKTDVEALAERVRAETSFEWSDAVGCLLLPPKRTLSAYVAESGSKPHIA